jgi:predicted SnoaL-like aldol condensation-catalyzing enzyme
MFKTLIAATCAVVLGAGMAIADVQAHKVLVQTALSEVLAKRDASKVDDYFAPDYIQRNPLLPSGSAPIKKFLSRPVEPDAPRPPANQMHRIIGEGDLVATHTTYYNFGPEPLVGFDIYRIENGRIAEHWDNLAPLAGPNPAGRTQVDGATGVTDLDRTEANRALVLELLERMFIGGERLDITQYISPVTYLQHNTDAGDGLQGLRKIMQENAAKGIKLRYDEIGIVVAEGNFVLTGTAGVINDQPTAFYDLWRLEDGLIVEHWDVIAPIRTENLPDGYPGKF